MVMTIKEKLQRIENLAKVGREHSYPCRYRGDVTNFMNEVKGLADEVIGEINHG